MHVQDTTWSALDDEQLRGRIFRYPQQKQVHIYRFIALGTPDVFLNNISFDKGQLHSAFVGCDPEIRESTHPCGGGKVNGANSARFRGDVPTADGRRWRHHFYSTQTCQRQKQTSAQGKGQEGSRDQVGDRGAGRRGNFGSAASGIHAQCARAANHKRCT